MLSEADASLATCGEFRLSLFSLTAGDMDAVTKVKVTFSIIQNDWRGFPRFS